MTRPGGYAGALLYVDLSGGEIRSEPLDPEFARRHLGGQGFGTRLFLDHLLAGCADSAGRVVLPDPLGPDNPFMLMTGPLTGAAMHATARWTVGARSPLTGLWGEANVGGFFGAELKAAGYDGVVITGSSPRPVYLRIEGGSAEILDGSALWGLDTFETEDTLVAAAEGRRPGQVLSVGPAGENLVRFACLVHGRGHVAGRTGMGAVWGAKRLKAIYVRGDRRHSPSHPESLSKLREELREIYSESIVVDALRAFGTMSSWDVGAVLGDIPIGNWRRGEWEGVDDLGPLAYAEKLAPRSASCYGCGVRCKREVEVSAGPFTFARGPGPEYETVVGFGSLCLNQDLEAVARSNDLCNRLGLDTISCGSTIAFAMDCREHGLLQTLEHGAACPPWGDGHGIVSLIEQIARREGLGDALAEGSARMASLLGPAAEGHLSTVKGLESPYHDPRAFHGLALAYAVSPRGACHMSGVGYSVETGGMYVSDIPVLAEPGDGPTSEGKAALHVAGQDYGTFFAGCAGFCTLGGMVLDAGRAVAMVNHVTGFEYSLQELTELGRRVWYMKRALSQVFGARGVDDRLPTLMAAPLGDGPAQESSPDMELMLGEFQALRRLRPDGLLDPKMLAELGLADLAEIL